MIHADCRLIRDCLTRYLRGIHTAQVKILTSLPKTLRRRRAPETDPRPKQQLFLFCKRYRSLLFFLSLAVLLALFAGALAYASIFHITRKSLRPLKVENSESL